MDLSGYYCPEEAIQVPNPLGAGDPITALAYDDHYHDALYVSLPSQSLQPRRAFRDHRASMLLSLVLNSSTSDDVIGGGEGGGGGGAALYASVPGHPEAPTSVLNAAYQAVYGGGITPPSTNQSSDPSSSSAPAGAPGHQRRPVHVPSHAYRPPYGTPNDPLAAVRATPYLPAPRKVFQMGISSIVGLPGHCASVSPSGVRLHQLGGFVEADRPLDGMLCGTALTPGGGGGGGGGGTGGNPTHLVVGGLALCNSAQKSEGAHSCQPQHVRCLDIWSGLRPVASYSITEARSRPKLVRSDVAVAAMAALGGHGSGGGGGGGGGGIVAGCTDGFLRLLDPRMREITGEIRGHPGGVVQVATSPYGDYGGTLIATTGYGSARSAAADAAVSSSLLYGFPNPSVLVYDIRYLGRGGIAHPFGGLRGGPRFVAFLPNLDGLPANRMVVASGQTGGGLQIITPFQKSPDSHPAAFIQPPLDRGSVTSMCVHEDSLALGTSDGTVLRYRLLGYNDELASMGLARPVRETVEILPYEPRAPPLSLDASLLLETEGKNSRMGMTERMKSIVSTYVLCREPTVSAVGDSSAALATSFGPLAARPMVAQSRLHVSAALLSKAAHSTDFVVTVPVSALNVNLMDDHRPARVKARNSDRKPPQPNLNKFLYTDKLFPLFYEESLNRTRRNGRRHRNHGVGDGDYPLPSGSVTIPNRYRLTIRPTHRLAATFNHHDYNETGFLPGWDYPPTMPNSFVPPVLMLFYAVPELRSTVPCGLYGERVLSMRSQLSELTFLFHRIDSLGRFALASAPSGSNARVGAWAPSNFISTLATMPETVQLQILDGSPAAVDPPRRPEAFYRFLLYQVDKEAPKDDGTSLRRVDSIGGMGFVSVNEFISGSVPPSHSSTRVMTVDLYYEGLEVPNGDEHQQISFADVLQRTLCRETRLRAWSHGSKSYETVVQRKVATSLPTVLSLSCACAGRKEEEGLKYWRGQVGEDSSTNWLPELIEVELTNAGEVIVREFTKGGDGQEGRWVESVNRSSIPQVIATIVSNLSKELSAERKRRYRLEAVLSIVRDVMDRTSSEVLKLVESGALGHLVLHTRVRSEVRVNMLEEQVKQLEGLLATGSSEYSLLGPIDDSWRERLKTARESLSRLQEQGSDNDWILVNGFVVSNTVVEDATSFHVKFKEPSLVVYRAVDEEDARLPPPPIDTAVVPPEVMRTLSTTDGSQSILAANQRLSSLPGRGDFVAFDAEFVSIQEEEASLSDTGSKMVVRETRYAVGRISIIDCRTRTVIVDDRVLPREPIVDYLTRFSGIVPKDLDPKQSRHHLVTTRDAYLKLRHLIERGCVFVGHGLLQDFWTINLAVPSRQIVDTVEIYHKPAQRFVSLRFLANFVLKRDMQQTVHDSVEDAAAAFDLYRTAVERKKAGTFDVLLDELYEYGNKNDWKLGEDDLDS